MTIVIHLTGSQGKEIEIDIGLNNVNTFLKLLLQDGFWDQEIYYPPNRIYYVEQKR